MNPEPPVFEARQEAPHQAPQEASLEPARAQEPVQQPNRQRRAIGADGRPRAGFFERSSLPGVPGGGVRAGLLDTTRAGDPLAASFMSVAGGIGGWNDPREGPTYGLGVSGGLARLSYEPGGALGPVGFDVGHGTFSAGATANRSTTQIGAQANILEGAATVAGRIGGDYQSLRVGGSLGGGYAGRLHYGDADGNGARELGFGVDWGHYSLDVKSETLGRAYNWAASRYARAFGRGGGS